MTVLTHLLRVSDGLVLSESVDPAYGGSQAQHLRRETATVVERMLREGMGTTSGAKRLRVDAGDHYICLTTRDDVLGATLFERSYPEPTAFKFLDEVLSEFYRLHGDEVAAVVESHSFMSFERTIHQTRKSYVDSRAQNLQRVTTDLNDVQDVMSKNINDILLRGEKIGTVAQKSEDLLAGTARYAKAAKDLNATSFKQKVAAVGVLSFVVLIYYLRGWWL